MSTDNVTPIRPGSEPPFNRQAFDIRQTIDDNLSQAKAITDLVSMADRETLFDDTIGWALHAVIDHIIAAREAVDELHELAAVKEEPRPA